MNIHPSIKGTVCINGKILSPDDAKVSIFDRGFLYGDSAFEVMRTYGGEPFCEREHLCRLQNSCQRLLIPMPVSIDQLSDLIHTTIQRSGMEDVYLRVVITRGSGPVGLGIAEMRDPLYIIYALPLVLPSADIYEEGIAAGLVHMARTVDGTLAVGAKTSNYLGSVLVLNEVKERGCQEAIVVNQNGEIIEGASSNIFIVKAGKLYTPAVESGILKGITRATVMKLAADLGIENKETLLYPQNLYNAQEVFITSSIREIVPVTNVDGIHIGDGCPGSMTRRLLHAYREYALKK